MMNAPSCPGGLSTLKSGTSPTHFSPFHWMPARFGSHGFPAASAEARLYMTRRLAGQLNAHWWNIPSPSGSALFRRAELFPASVKTPECSQLPHIVLPSSRSCANPSSCSPAALSTLGGSLDFGSLGGSVTSDNALPLISFSASPRSGLRLLVYFQSTLSTC